MWMNYTRDAPSDEVYHSGRVVCGANMGHKLAARRDLNGLYYAICVSTSNSNCSVDPTPLLFSSS